MWTTDVDGWLVLPQTVFSVPRAPGRWSLLGRKPVHVAQMPGGRQPYMIDTFPITDYKQVTYERNEVAHSSVVLF